MLAHVAGDDARGEVVSTARWIADDESDSFVSEKVLLRELHLLGRRRCQPG
jgi:hypothetical protein